MSCEELIADGVFSPDCTPIGSENTLISEYNLVTLKNAGAHFGESNMSEGIPFARPLSISGMCAQACCYMANILKLDDSSGAYGISEITALASGQGNEIKLAEFEVGGLNQDKIALYFDQDIVGLRAIPQAFDSELYPESTALTLCKEAMSAYITAGMPVILTVDLGRLIGSNPDGVNPKNKMYIPKEESIYSQNYYPQEFIEKRAANHSILIVGESKTPSSNPNYLFQDPASFPFMTATFEELMKVRAYRKNAYPALDLIDPTIVPVTPRRIQLFPYRPQSVDSLLYRWSRLKKLHKFSYGDIPSRFALAKAKDLKEHLKSRDLLADCSLESEERMWARFDAKLSARSEGLLKDTWCWAHAFDDQCIIWNAESEAKNYKEELATGGVSNTFSL